MFRKYVKFATAIFCVGIVFSLTHCGQQNTTTTVSGTFTDVYTNLLSGQCIQCHVSGGANDGSPLDFSTQANAYSTLKNGVVAGSAKPACAGLPLVTSSTSTSYVLASLFTAYYSDDYNNTPGCDPYNHGNGAGLKISSAQQASIVAWIQAGAPNN